MNVTYAGFAGRPDEWGLNGNEAGAERLIAYQKFLRRGDISLTHTIVQPTVDKAIGDAPAPGNVHALHKVADTEHGIVVRGARVLATLAPFADELAVYPGRAAARRRRRLCPVVLRADGRARAEIHVPRQRLGAGQPLRSSAVEPLRRAGCLRHLRRRRGAARPRLHRLQPRRLQHGDDHELVAQHPAADDDPGLDQARLRLGPGAAHGGRDQRGRSRDHAHDRRDLGLCGVHARRGGHGRSRGARMAGRAVDARRARRCMRCAPCCRCGSRG